MKNLKILLLLASLFLVSEQSSFGMDNKLECITKNEKVFQGVFIVTTVAMFAGLANVLDNRLYSIPLTMTSLFVFYKIFPSRDKSNRKALALKAFSKLPSNDDKCCICLCQFTLDFKDSEKIPVQDWCFMSCCKQFVCHSCITEFVKTSKSCPLCRAPIQDDTVVYDATVSVVDPERRHFINENPNY